MSENRFKWLGRLEGSSLLILLFIAMPIKYLAGHPEAVRVVGAIHGALFILYVLSAIAMAVALPWRKTTLILCLIFSSVPFGTFYFERKYLR